MFKALAFGLGVGVGIQALRNWPPTAQVTSDAMAVVFIVGLLCAYFGGRARRGAHASAFASAESHATSVASNSVNVAVVVPGAGAGSLGGGVAVPSESAPWITSTTTPAHLSLEQLDGMDVAEILESHPDRTV